jgi:hypothetical protein
MMHVKLSTEDDFRPPAYLASIIVTLTHACTDLSPVVGILPVAVNVEVMVLTRRIFSLSVGLCSTFNSGLGGFLEP